MLAALILLFFQHGHAQAPTTYDCHYTSGDQGTIQLAESFSTTENMRIGSVTIDNPNQTTVHWNTRVYQFLMPDNQRYIQMWYLSSDFHVDGLLQVSSSNEQFAATLKNLNSQAALLCRKN